MLDVLEYTSPLFAGDLMVLDTTSQLAHCMEMVNMEQTDQLVVNSANNTLHSLTSLTESHP